MSKLQGSVAVITGASRGIGWALALAGCHVVIAAKSTTSSAKLPDSWADGRPTFIIYRRVKNG